MVEISIKYLGDLRCEATHGPSGTTLLTDAPVDNEGVILQMQDVEWGLHQLCQERRSRRRDISGGGTLISDQKRPMLCTVVWKSGKPTGLIT